MVFSISLIPTTLMVLMFLDSHNSLEEKTHLHFFPLAASHDCCITNFCNISVGSNFKCHASEHLPLTIYVLSCKTDLQSYEIIGMSINIFRLQLYTRSHLLLREVVFQSLLMVELRILATLLKL